MCWLTPGKYMRVILPTRTAISGPLLDVTFKAYYEKAKERLLKEAGMYGITVGRDGATIDNKCPLFNAIACSVSNQAWCWMCLTVQHMQLRVVKKMQSSS
jgi:predicted RNase H-related nuclease YkuK (DUF458 family)